MKRLINGVVLATLMSLPALADPLAQGWLDKVTHEIQQAEGPLSTRPVDFKFRGGLFGYRTDNLFLEPNKRANSDLALIPFVGGRVEYAESKFEVAADLLISYEAFYMFHEARNDQEHFYGRVRYADGVIDAQLVEILRRETDALDAVFADHVTRFVGNTLPRFGVKLSKLFFIEGFANIETVHFEGSDFDSRENQSYRPGVRALMSVTNRINVGAAVGYIRIHYRQSRLTPGAEGWFAHLSARAELIDNLTVEAGVGYSSIKPLRREPGKDSRESQGALDAEIHARYQAMSTLLILADYTRQFGFAGSGSAYQTLDRVVLIAEWQAIEPLQLRLRAQGDRVRPSNQPIRTYFSGTIEATYSLHKNVALSGGFTARFGNTHKSSEDNYDNWIVYAGVIFSF
jgi:hypothetical protein